MKRIFRNGREFRSGWRLLLFCILIFVIGWGLQAALSKLPLERYSGLNAVDIIVFDAAILLLALAATFIMSRIEHRSFATYGIPGIRELLGRKFWIGTIWGFAMPSAVIVLIAIGGGYRVHGLNVTGVELVKYAALWMVATFLIGAGEEILFRGYFLYTLADGIGFWPAAIFEAIGFGALHYFTKPYERWEDWVAVTLITIFIQLAFRRTGSLAFPIGMHAAFDFAFMYVFSGRNGGEFAVGRLLDAQFPGSNWLTGGMLGPEASWFMLIVAIAATVLLNFVYRQAKWPVEN